MPRAAGPKESADADAPAGDAWPGDAEASAAPDVTLGGYLEMHGRPPAFEGCDGQPYTADVDTEESEDGERRWAAFLVFLHWAAKDAAIMDHRESGDIAHGATEQEARRGALALSLYQVKAELDAAIERRKSERENSEC